MIRFCFLMVSVLTVAACTNLSDLQEQQRLSERTGQMEQAYQKLHHQQTPSWLIETDDYYVRDVQDLQQERQQPTWGLFDVDFAIAGYPIKAFLQELLKNKKIQVHFRDELLPEQLVDLTFKGTFFEALDLLAAQLTWSYVLTEQAIYWYQYEVAELDVSFLAGETNFFLGEDASLQGVGQAWGLQSEPLGADAGQQYINFTSQRLSIWEDLKVALSILLSSQGELVINQSSTSILVRDLPYHVGLVRQYIEQQNERMTRQVAVDIQVIEVSFYDQEQRGIQWDVVSESLSGSTIVNLFTQPSQHLAVGGAALQLNRQHGRFAGSSMLLEVLQEQGQVEVSTHPRVVSLNNQISKVILEENVAYLASAGSNSTPNVGTSDVLIPGNVKTGFELYLMPKIAGEQIVLQLSTSLSDLVGIEQISSGDKTIQTPQTTRKKFFMKAMVQNQETLLISGLQSSRVKRKEQKGMFSWLFGGSKQREIYHTETLVLLTPRKIGI